MSLGDVAQSMGFNKDNAYLVMNNSSTVEVVNRYTFESMATVSTMIMTPRFIAFEGNKGYVTNWGDPNDITDDYVAVLNLDTNLIESKIPVAEGPDKIVVNNGKLYVAHRGGYHWGNTLSVIDIATQKVTGSISVGDVPDDMLVDSGKLYVICSGKGDYTGDETQGKLLRINIADSNVEKTLTFPEKKHPRFLSIANNMLYYTLGTDVFTINTSNFELPENSLFSTSTNGLKLLYGFKVNKNNIYIADAKDYVSNGNVFIYSLTGDLQKTFSVQIIPNSFYFNNQN